MLNPFAATPAVSESRLSRPALVTALALHLGLLWFALQAPPMVRSAEQVVYQWMAPITTPRQVSGPITLPKPTAPPQAIQAATPAAVLPPAPSQTAITQRVEPPQTPPPPTTPVPVPVPPPPPVPVAVQVPAPVTPPIAPPPVAAVVTAPVAAPEPVAPPEVAKPLPEPSRVRREVAPLPSFAPTQDTKLEAKVDLPNTTVNIQAPPAPEPPAPAPSPTPVVVDAAPAVAPPPAVAQPARQTAITVTERPAGGGGPTNPSGSSANAGAGANAANTASGTGAPLNLNLTYPSSMLRSPPRQRSAAELANQQLNGDGVRNRLGESVNAATKPDCLSREAGLELGLLALPLAAVQAARDKCK